MSVELQQGLERIIGYQFRNPTLLRQALTHRSFGSPHNERLEFLGDSVLNCVTARLLFDTFPQLSEGDLSRLRACLVKKETLAAVAIELNLGCFLWLGEGELKSGGIQRPSILADALEALLGAICLDDDYQNACDVIKNLFRERVKAIDPLTFGKDGKTVLQELLQARKLPLPCYEVLRQEEDGHDQHFEVACVIPSLGIKATGSGGSRRAAEQLAASAALLEAHQKLPVRKERRK